MRKSSLAREGDKVKFQTHLPTKEGVPYQKGTLYDGVVIRHKIDQITQIEIIDDNKQKTIVDVFYDIFSDGLETFELMISEEEFEVRKKEWIESTCQQLRKEMEEKLAASITAVKETKFY